MRTIFLSFFFFLNGTVGSLFSLLLLAYCLFPEKLGMIEAARLDIPLAVGVWKLILILFSLSLLFGNVLILFKVLGGSSRDEYIKSKTPDGEGPGVSLRALENSLLRAARNLPEIKKISLQVKKAGDKEIRVEVQYVTFEGLNVIEVSEKLRRVLDARFNEIINLEEGCRLEFNIRLDRLASGTVREGREEKAKEEETFTGPKFPVD